MPLRQIGNKSRQPSQTDPSDEQEDDCQDHQHHRSQTHVANHQSGDCGPASDLSGLLDLMQRTVTGNHAGDPQERWDKVQRDQA